MAMSARQWQLLLDGDRDDVTVLGQVQTGFEQVQAGIFLLDDDTGVERLTHLREEGSTPAGRCYVAKYLKMFGQGLPKRSFLVEK